MIKAIIVGLGIAGLTSLGAAAPMDFDFKDPKGVNNAVFKLDAPLEIINGTAAGISGKVTVDFDNLAATKGEIVVDTATLHVGNPMMKEHLHSAQWMDVAKFPKITFQVTSLSDIQQTDNVTTAKVTGVLTIKGISQNIRVTAKATYLKDKLKARVPNMEGDLLVIRTNFSIKRSDFGINKGMFEDKVADVIDLTLNIAGSAPR